MTAAVSLLLFVGVLTLMPLAWAHWGMPWLPLIVTFLVLPLLDPAIGRPCGNVFAGTPPAFARWVPRAQLPFQAILLTAAVLMAPRLDTAALLQFALAIGAVTGGIGSTIAHELGDRASRLDRAIARALLASVGYGHFQVGHSRGHHVRVATSEDPASAPRGMNVYRFIRRSVCGGVAHARALEAMRPAARGRAVRPPAKAVLAGLLSSLMLAAGAWAAGGSAGLLLFAMQAVWAFVLLEIISYIEPHGVRRRLLNGRYEPVAPRHSWNADFALSNWLLFNLQRHSDQHARMERPYEQLHGEDLAPQPPAGDPTMVLAALLPPLWFALMDRRLPVEEVIA